jgi:hypothetical protein
VPDGEKRVHLEYGFVRVRLPGRRDVELSLMVVRGLGEEPLLLLTNVAVKPTRRSLWWVVSGYLTRWLVEETIRFIKQSYRLEDLRVLDYERLRNLAALVMAAAYFAAVWLGESLKLAVLASRVSRLAKRFFGVPEFHYYALADGIAVLLSRLFGSLLPVMPSGSHSPTTQPPTPFRFLVKTGESPDSSENCSFNTGPLTYATKQYGTARPWPGRMAGEIDPGR